MRRSTHTQIIDPDDSNGLERRRGLASSIAAFVSVWVAKAASASVVAFVLVMVALSFGSAIIGGDEVLATHEASFISLGLLSLFSGMAVHVWSSTVPFITAGPYTSMAPLLASVAHSLSAQCAPDSWMPTTIVCFSLMSIISGLMLCALSHPRIQMGKAAAYLPAPVLTGMMIAIGVTLIIAALQITTGITLVKTSPLGPMTLLPFTQDPDVLWRACQQSACAVAVGLLLFSCRYFRRLTSILLTPAILLSAIISFYFIVFFLGHSEEQLRSEYWLSRKLTLEKPSDAFASTVELISGLAGGRVDWTVLFDLRTSPLQALPVYCVVDLLLVLATLPALVVMPPPKDRAHVSPDRELATAGISAIIQGLIGVPGASYFVGTTQQHRDLGGDRASGCMIVAFCGLALGCGPLLASSVPRFVLGGLFMNFALGYLVNASVLAMTGAEYFVLVATCVTYIGLGGMAGLMVGLIFTCLAFVIEQSSLDSALLVDSVDRGRSLSSVGLTAELSPGVLIAARKQNVTISLQGNIFFATTHSLTKEILRNVDAHGPASMGCVLLNFKRVQSVDISAIHTLAQLAAELGTRGWELKSTGLRSRLAKRFAKLGLIVVNAALVSPAGMAPASMDEENGTVSAASTLSDIPTGPDSSSHSLERDSRTPCRTLLQHLAHAEEHVELPVPRSGSGLLRYAVLNDSVESFAPLSGRPPLIPGGYDSGHGSGHGSFNPGGLRYQMANDSVESLHAFGGLGQRRNSPMFHGAHDLKELPPPLEQDESVTAPLGLHSHPLSKSAEERVDDAGGCECAGAVSVPDDLSKFEELFKSLGVVEFVPAQFVVLQANDVVVATEVIFLLEGDAIQWRARRTNTGEATDFSRASLKRAGNMLGATEVILGTSRHFSAHMLTDGQIVRLTVKHMREIRASRPEVWEMLILKALQGSTNIVREFLFLQEE